MAASAAIAQDAASVPLSEPPKEVSGPEISMLIRTTMIAVHQANVTGNYTVLRDLGASILKASNTAADLAALFAEFRKSNMNLAPTVLFDAELDEKPALSTNGVLRLVGHFPTKPQEVIFDMTFSYELGAWHIAVINIGTRLAVADATPPPNGQATAPLGQSAPAPAKITPAPKTGAQQAKVPVPRMRPNPDGPQALQPTTVQ
jgi:hypothetical protein